MEPTRQYMPYSGYPYGVPSTTRQASTTYSNPSAQQQINGISHSILSSPPVHTPGYSFPPVVRAPANPPVVVIPSFPPVPGPTVYRSGQGTPVPVTGIPVTTPVILSVTPVIPLPVAQVPHTPVVTTYTQPSTPAQFIPLSAPQIQNQTGRSWHYAPMRYNQNS
jgi:hypothetical protein